MGEQLVLLIAWIQHSFLYFEHVLEAGIDEKANPHQVVEVNPFAILKNKFHISDRFFQVYAEYGLI